MSKPNQSSQDIKKILWAGANTLRGNVDPSEYKQVFLGLIFLKFISERFERKYEQLKDEGAGFENDRTEYTSEGIYFVPPDVSWREIAAKCSTDDVGMFIDHAIHRVEQENLGLKGVLPKYYARAELDKNRLIDLIRLFDENIDTETSIVTLGRVYEYCLMKFAEQEGRRAGEFYTPHSVVRTLVGMINARHGRLYDPCCGSGGLFIAAQQFAEELGGDKGDLSFYGQESNATTWKMCLMNLAIHGIEADVGKYNSDTFLQSLHPNLSADFILASPPFNMSEWGGEKLWNDKRWIFGMPPSGNANYAWLQHMFAQLSPVGRMGVVLSNGALTTQNSAEMGIRKKMIEQDLIECIVSMPSHLFYNTSIPFSIWIINKEKLPSNRNKVLFIDAINMGETLGRAQKEMKPEEIRKISEKIQMLRGEVPDLFYADEPGFCVLADIEKIRETDYALSPGRYVGIADPGEEAELHLNTLPDLISELRGLMRENRDLEYKLAEKLGELGYEH